MDLTLLLLIIALIVGIISVVTERSLAGVAVTVLALALLPPKLT
jgi:hypothetical protein